MKNIGGRSDLKRKKSLRLGLLLISSIFIIGASALVYARVIYETPLNVGSTNGTTTGSGPTASAGESFPPAIIAVLAVSAFVIGISLFFFLREAYKRVSKTPNGPDSTPPIPESSPPTEEDKEESPTKDEGTTIEFSASSK